MSEIPPPAVISQSVQTPSITELKRQKLLLEMAELRRSQWWKPAVMAPIIAGLVTLFIAQRFGIFDVERKRIEVANQQSEMTKSRLEEEVKGLKEAKVALQAERQTLEERKHGLGLQVGNLEGQLVLLQTSSNHLKQQAFYAERRAQSAQRRLRETEEVLAMPHVEIDDSIVPDERRANISLVNRGAGPARIRYLRTYVDNKLIPEGTPQGPLLPLLRELGISEPWLRSLWDVGDTLLPGGSDALLLIEPTRFDPVAEKRFREAAHRLGLEVCYCSPLGRCAWATFHRPATVPGTCNAGDS